MLVGIWGVFFYKTFAGGSIPFPGDLLVSGYKPWSTESYLGYNPGSVPSKAQYFDTIRQMVPWKSEAVTQLRAGSVPLWNPHNFSGAPLVANNQSAVFHPTIFLFLVLPLWLGWTLSVMLQPILASLFTYLYCRTIKLRPLPSVMASVVYAYGMYAIVFLEYNTILHVTLLLPLILTSIEHLIRGRSVWWSLILATAVYAAGTAGHLQLFVTVVAYAGIYAVWRVRSEKRKSDHAVSIGLPMIIGLGLGSLQHIPTAELVMHAARVPQSYESLLNTLLIQPKQLMMLFVPDAFGNPATYSYILSDSYPSKAMFVGIPALVLSHIAMRSVWNNAYVKLFTGTVVVLLAILVASPITAFLYRFEIPLISTSAPTNMLFLLTWSFAVLAAHGLTVVIERKTYKPWYTVGFFAAAFAMIWIVTRVRPGMVMIKPLLLSTGVTAASVALLSAAAMTKRTTIVAGFFIFLTVAELGYYFHKFNPFVSKELFFPQTEVSEWLIKQGGHDRFWGYGSAAIEANYATMWGAYSPDGYDPLYPAWYGKFIQLSADGSFPEAFTSATRSDARIAGGFGETDYADNMYRQRVLNMLGARYLINRVENGDTQTNFPPSRYPLLASFNDWQVFENTSALPRAFVVYDMKLHDGDDPFDEFFFDESFDPRQSVFIANIARPNFEEIGTGSATIRKYTPSRVTIDTDTTQPGILVLSDTYFPGWKATVNEGTQLAVHRANYALRAVLIPAGKNTVIFSYEPASFSWGLKGTMISTVVLAGYIVAIRRRSRKRS